jgi:hypothetical protein
MQLRGAIARYSGESCYSGINTKSLASSLSRRYSPLFFPCSLCCHHQHIENRLRNQSRMIGAICFLLGPVWYESTSDSNNCGGAIKRFRRSHFLLNSREIGTIFRSGGGVAICALHKCSDFS